MQRNADLNDLYDLHDLNDFHDTRVVIFDILDPCWVLEKSEEPCRILKKFVHACVVNVIHAKVLPGCLVGYECM